MTDERRMRWAERSGAVIGLVLGASIFVLPMVAVELWTPLPPTAWWVALLIISHVHLERRGRMTATRRIASLIALAAIAWLTGMLYAGWPPEPVGVLPI